MDLERFAKFENVNTSKQHGEILTTKWFNAWWTFNESNQQQTEWNEEYTKYNNKNKI